MNNSMRIFLAIAMAVAPAGAFAQAITPDPEPHTIDKGCLGPADIQNEESLQYETFIKSAIELSPVARTVTLPLYKGFDVNGDPVYYIVTDASDCETAKQFKVNYAPKLANLLDPVTHLPGTKAVQAVTFDSGGAVHFQGTADFSPIRAFVAGATGWPPAMSVPGAVGDANYTPFITYKNKAGKYVVLNASQVANKTGIKDYVPEVDFQHMTAKFNLVMGIYDFAFVMYLRMDASNDVVTGFEGGIFAPNPGQAPTAGVRLLSQGTARQTILPVVNGITGTDKIYDRQGLASGALGEGDPLNVLGARPGDDEYSPIWDITPVLWTDAAITAGKRQRLHQDDEVRNFVHDGWLVGVGGGPLNADIGVNSFPAVSNCPVMLRMLKGMPAYAGGK
jgi:hypothetical protein